MEELTVGQISGLRPRIERKRSTDQNTGCIVWTGGTAAKPPYPRFDTSFEGKRLTVSVRQFVWIDEHGKIPEGHRLWMLCETPLCTNTDHMELLTAYEFLDKKKQIKTFNPNEYKYVNCNLCGHMCRQRGKYQLGVYRAYQQDDGSIICGMCVKKNALQALALDKSETSRYTGSIDDLVEDVEWLLDFGESPIAAAGRLKFDSVETFYTTLVQIDREDLVTRFKRIGVVNDVQEIK